jgi:alcohol dehydrogenase class IV
VASSACATYQVPPTVVLGAGASRTVAEHARRLGADRALLVSDEFLVRSGVAAVTEELLAGAGIAVSVFAGVQPDPTDENVRAGLRAFRASAAQVVVALGGGSVLDAAKAISVLVANPEPLSRYMGYHRIPAAGPPLIAIPTTAGTGSEATRVTVIRDVAADTKMMILDGHLVPAVALVDYELSLTMPRALTAHVGVDTLTHGIEAYVSSAAGPLTDAAALSCVRLVAEHLERAYEAPDDRRARAAMAAAACQGGMAFSNASVCLVHGMSRPLGAMFHVPHGLSNAVLLPAVTRFSRVGAPDRYATVARTMGLAPEELVPGLEALNERLGVPRLRDLPGVTRERFEASLPKMAADALASGSPARNPVVPTAEEIVDLYRGAW